MSFIAGRYTATLGASSLGQLTEGIRVEHQVFKRIITGDAMADTPQDAVYRGMAMFCQYTLMEYNASAAEAAFWPYGSYLTQGTVGRLDSGIAAQLVLTAVSGTPAAATPATLTFPLAILAEGFPVSILYAPDLREVPIRQRLYPNSSGVYGTET